MSRLHDMKTGVVQKMNKIAAQQVSRTMQSLNKRVLKEEPEKMHLFLTDIIEDNRSRMICGRRVQSCVTDFTLANPLTLSCPSISRRLQQHATQTTNTSIHYHRDSLFPNPYCYCRVIGWEPVPLYR